MEIEKVFETVRQEKVKEMSSELHVAPKKPKITAIIVAKRHHVRFYPTDAADKDDCKSGTVVDSGVTNPVYTDFYLQSHDPPMGTAKLTHYFVLRNDIDFTSTEMQDLTYALCFTYVRYTLPVGYCLPAYYADQLCERARLYIKRTTVRGTVDGVIVPSKLMCPAKVFGESCCEEDQY